MNVKIVPILDHIVYRVNDHIVYKNFLKNWACENDLSDKEIEAFKLYENLVINNSRIKKHIKVIYR